MKNNIIPTILIAVIVGAAAFYGGTVYGQSMKSAQANTFQQVGSGQGGRQFGTSGQGGSAQGRGGNLVNGQIISKDDKSITIKLRNGGSQFVFFSPTTQILKSTTGTAGDLLTDANISASGITNSDGSVTAQMIQIRPAGTDPFGNRGGGSTQQSGGSVPSGVPATTPGN